jgi:hypothetical protein
MTEFLRSVKSDLLSRRLLPFVALLGVALIAAAGYAATGGSSSGTSPSPSTPSAPAVAGRASLPVAVAQTNPHLAVSETPAGTRFQSHGPTRDPFVPLPSPQAEKSATSASPSSSSSNAGGSSGGGSSGGASSPGTGGSGGAQKAPAPAPKKPSKPTFPYLVSVLFGRSSTVPGQPATLAPYENIKPSQHLPSKQNSLISFERITASGDGAVFAFVVPPILRGTGICLPSTSECQSIDVQVGHVEELEYVEADGQVVVYELKIVSILKKSAGASAARAKHDAKPAQARFKAMAGQSIGQASEIEVSPAAGSAQSTRR